MIKGFTLNRTTATLDEAKALVTAAGWLDGYPYPIVMGIIENIEKERAHGIHVTQITGCPRKAYLALEIDEFPTLERCYWMFRGTLIHAVLENITEPGSIVEQTFDRFIDGTMVVGTPDKITPSRKELSDWKTAKKVVAKNLPYGEHAKQVNTYRWLVEPEYEIDTLLITYMDMGDCITIAVEIEDVTEYIRERACGLDYCITQSILPDPELGWLCGYCDFKEHCPEGMEYDQKRRSKSH